MRAALGKPFSKHCPELHGMNSDGLCLTIRFSVAEAAFKKQFSDGLLDKLVYPDVSPTLLAVVAVTFCSWNLAVSMGVLVSTYVHKRDARSS